MDTQKKLTTDKIQVNKELAGVKRRYLSNGVEKVEVFYSFDQNKFSSMINNLQAFERPDFVSFCDNAVIGVEHFGFDSYSNTNRGGSSYHKQKSYVEKQIRNRVRDLLAEEEVATVHDKISDTSSLDNYYDNFEKAFLSHYSKIDTYINRIKNNKNYSNEEVEMWFFAEDTNRLGNYRRGKSGSLSPMYPFYSAKILNMLKESRKIKGIIFGTSIDNKSVTTIFNNDLDVINRLEGERPRVSESEFISFEEHIINHALKMTAPGGEVSPPSPNSAWILEALYTMVG